jgi:hypothetical protein
MYLAARRKSFARARRRFSDIFAKRVAWRALTLKLNDR